MEEKEGGSERNIAGDERFPGTGYQIERTVWVMCVCVCGGSLQTQKSRTYDTTM